MIEDLYPWTILISNDRGIVRVQEFSLGLGDDDKPIELKLQVIDAKDAHTVDFYLTEEHWQRIKGLVESRIEDIRRRQTGDAARHREEREKGKYR